MKIDYKLINREKENDYYYAPFTEQRRQLRQLWNRQKGECWEEFLFNAEIAYNDR